MLRQEKESRKKCVYCLLCSNGNLLKQQKSREAWDSATNCWPRKLPLLVVSFLEMPKKNESISNSDWSCSNEHNAELPCVGFLSPPSAIIAYTKSSFSLVGSPPVGWTVVIAAVGQIMDSNFFVVNRGHTRNLRKMANKGSKKILDKVHCAMLPTRFLDCLILWLQWLRHAPYRRIGQWGPNAKLWLINTPCIFVILAVTLVNNVIPKLAYIESPRDPYEHKRLANQI